MSKRRGWWLHLIIVGGLTLTNPAWAEEMKATADEGPKMLADAVVVRPFGVMATVLGSALYLVTLPLTLSTGSHDSAQEELVSSPARFTFNRQLGDFE